MPMESDFYYGSKMRFKLGEGSSLLKFVKKINGGVTVERKGLRGPTGGHPLFSHVSGAFNFQGENSSGAKVSMARAHTPPVSNNLLLKLWIVEQGAIETENRRLWNSGSGG